MPAAGPPEAAGTPGGPPAADFSFAVRRARGTGVVTARGVLDGDGSHALGDVLTDLIDDRGNLAVVVDLHDLGPGRPEHLGVFAAAARSAGGAARWSSPSQRGRWRPALEALGLAHLTASLGVNGGPAAAPPEDRRRREWAAPTGPPGPAVARRPAPGSSEAGAPDRSSREASRPG